MKWDILSNTHSPPCCVDSPFQFWAAGPLIKSGPDSVTLQSLAIISMVACQDLRLGSVYLKT